MGCSETNRRHRPVTSMELRDGVRAELGLQQAEHFPLPFFLGAGGGWNGRRNKLNSCDEEKM